MFNKLLSYKTEIKTRFKYNENESDELAQLLVKFIQREFNVESNLNGEGQVYFETELWRSKWFQPEVGIFNFTIDAGLIYLIKSNNMFGLKIEISFLRLLIMIYSISFLLIIVGVIYTEWNLISLLTLIPIFGPLLIVYPLSIFGARIFISKMEKLK